jgi:hypothetical protein
MSTAQYGTMGNASVTFSRSGQKNSPGLQPRLFFVLAFNPHPKFIPSDLTEVKIHGLHYA